jgi:hypothetical protein
MGPTLYMLRLYCCSVENPMGPSSGFNQSIWGYTAIGSLQTSACVLFLTCLFSLLGSPLASAHAAATLPGIHIKHMTEYRTVTDKNNNRYYYVHIKMKSNILSWHQATKTCIFTHYPASNEESAQERPSSGWPELFESTPEDSARNQNDWLPRFDPSTSGCFCLPEFSQHCLHLTRIPPEADWCNLNNCIQNYPI